MTAAAVKPSVFERELKYSVELSGIRLEQEGAAADIAGGQFDVAQKRATLGFAVELGRLVGFVDEGRDIAHKPRIDRPFDRNRGHNRGDDRGNGGDQRKQGHEPAVQPRARPRRPARRSEPRQLHRNEDDEDEDDQAVAHHQDQDDGRGGNDGRDARENEERRQSEDESRADDDNSKPAGRPAVIQDRRRPRVDSRRSSQIREPKIPKPLAEWRPPLARQWQTGNDVAQLRLFKRTRQTEHLAVENGAFWGGGFSEGRAALARMSPWSVSWRSFWRRRTFAAPNVAAMLDRVRLLVYVADDGDRKV